MDRFLKPNSDGKYIFDIIPFETLKFNCRCVVPNIKIEEKKEMKKYNAEDFSIKQRERSFYILTPTNNGYLYLSTNLKLVGGFESCLYFESIEEAEKAIEKFLIKTGSKKMKKSNLESGMVIEDLDGDRFIILDVCDELIAFDYDGDDVPLSSIDEDLYYIEGGRIGDITKIYYVQKDGSGEIENLMNLDSEYLELFWEREKEKTIEEKRIEELLEWQERITSIYEETVSAINAEIVILKNK